jgi:hypothetical protein
VGKSYGGWGKKFSQARALGPPKIFLFYKEFRPQKNSLNFI